MGVFNIAAKGSAIMAGAVSLYDVHKLGVNQARKDSAKNYADSCIATELGCSKLNYPSEKDAAIKNWVNGLEFPHNISKGFGFVKGYLSGALKGIINNVPMIGFSALSFFAKGKLQKAGVIGLGISTAWNFLKNGTNLFERTDYLK